MAMVPGGSLLAALLDTDYNRLTPEQSEKALDMLYEALYCIIEHKSMPANKDANRAIGRALAEAMQNNRSLEEAKAPQNESQLRITALRSMLTGIAREAAGLSAPDNV